MVDGPTDRQIAVRMGLTEETVGSHFRKLMKLADVNNRVHLVLKVVRGEIRLVER